MKIFPIFILAIICLFFCVSKGFAWTDDVEGMLMTSPMGEDNMSDPEAIMENVEPSEDTSSENTVPTTEWE